MPGSSYGRPVLCGEVLFDRFPDGTAVLGGAPFNVAWHLAGFGLAPLLISRVGADADGDAVLRAMRDWGMDTAGMQRDQTHATGVVHVSLDAGQPTFDIAADRAFDHIDAEAALHAAARCRAPLLYHGTLAARGERSRATLRALRASALPAFVDVNLRPPWAEPARLAPLLNGARWLKLNDAELRALGPPPAGDAVAAARTLMARVDAQAVILTLGAAGAAVVTADEVLRGAPAPVARFVDAVGAGDAFSAVFIAGIVLGWPPADTLQRALAFASGVCAIRGATTRDRAVYERARESWAPAAAAP